MVGSTYGPVPEFGRGFFAADHVASRIAGGALGGKAEGLLRIEDALRARYAAAPFRDVQVSIPRMSVLATDVFDDFMRTGRLYEVALSGASDERIARAFQQAQLPPGVLGDLRAVVEGARVPLAVRSSSLLEDALAHPFAGVYETKMVPNNAPDASTRFQGLTEAIKLVYASTFFDAARTYRRAIGAEDRAEKMAVVIQEVIGERHGDRFYPHLSGVARSFNYYPVGAARPEDGVVQLALGLGKTIVDGGVCWTYSPRFPASPPPFSSARDMLTATQGRFWAVHMGAPPPWNPIAETEHLVEAALADAEYDDTLRHLASTYVAASDRMSPGVGREGPRVLDFAPLLQLRDWPLNDVAVDLLAVAGEATGGPVEIEFAATLPGGTDRELRFGLVQVRAMATPGEAISVAEEDLGVPDTLLSSRRAVGNRDREDIEDVVYVRPDRFDPARSREVAAEVAELNRALMDAGRPYVLIGFGRWGSADPWLGIPVVWGQVAGAKVLVEATLPQRRIDPSQGSHFFHNVSSLGVVVLSVGADETSDLRWEWLDALPSAAETRHVRHVRTERPLHVRVDGRSGRGFVRLRGASRGRP